MILSERRNYGVALKMGLILLLSFIMALACPTQARAAEATINHKHTSNCYEIRPVNCTDEIVITTHNEDFNCSTCGRVASARVVVETYSCKYEYSERELRRMAYCYTCNSVVQSQTTSASATHLRAGQVCICGMDESTVIAKVNLSAASTAWTKGNVVLNASVTEPTSGQSLAPYTYSFSGGTASGNSCTVSTNGTYSVTVTASNGQQASTSIQVKNIDKDAPKITQCYVDKEYPEYESANIIVEATDSASGLAASAYSFDGGKTYIASNRYAITANGTYKICVKDKVGNSSTKTLTVTCFEKKPEPEETTKPENSGSDSTQGGNSQGSTGQNGQNSQNGQSGAGQSGNYSGGSDGQQSGENTGDDESVNKDKTTATNSGKTKGKEETDLTDREKEYALLKEKLEQSEYKVPLEKIPGVYSSLMQLNAEKNAVPMTLNVVNEKTDPAYSSGTDSEENLVKNISISSENTESGGSFAQVSKGIVGVGVLLCIGMVAFLVVFLVKKQ